MCEAPQTGSNAKPDDTFTQVVEQIEELKSNYLEQYSNSPWFSKLFQGENVFKKSCEKPLDEVEAGLFKAYSSPNLYYDRLKTYLECKIMEYDTDMKKWMADFLTSVTKIILSVLVGTAALKLDKLDFCQQLKLYGVVILVSMFFVVLICIWLGLSVEIPMKIRHNQKRFYEICLKVLEQYLPAKNEVNNSQNLKCSVKTNSKHKKNKK